MSLGVLDYTQNYGFYFVRRYKAISRYVNN